MSTVQLTAEVAGTVWKVLVAPGDMVAADAALVIIESMKMEIPVAAPTAGRVVSVWVEEGESVSEGQALLAIDAMA